MTSKLYKVKSEIKQNSKLSLGLKRAALSLGLKRAALSLGLILVAGIAIGCTQADATETGAAARPVAVAEVSQAKVKDNMIAIGKVVPFSSLEVGIATGGKVVDILVKEGQAVEKGQVLYKLDQSAVVTSRDQALRGIRSGIAALEDQIADTKAQLADTQEQMADAKSQIVDLEAQLAEMEKAEGTDKQGSLGQQVTAPAKQQLEATLAQVQKAPEQLEKAQAQLEKALRALNRQLADAKANLSSQTKTFDNTLSNFVVKSPAKGVVTGLNFKVGELVGPQDILRIVSAEDYLVETAVTASQLRRIQEAQDKGSLSATLYLEGDVNQALPAELLRIDIVQNPQSGLYNLQLGMDTQGLGEMAAKYNIYAGEYVEVRLETDSRTVQTLPLSAIKRLGSDAFAFYIEEGQAKRISLTLGKVVGDAVEILAGLESYPQATQWIVKGVDDLQDGVSVIVQSEVSQK